MTLVARCVFFSAALSLAACSSITRSPPSEAPKVEAKPTAQARTTPKSSPPQPIAHEEHAAPPAAVPRQPPATAATKTPEAPKVSSAPSKAPAAAAAATAPKPSPVAAKPPPVTQAAAPKAAPLDLKTLEQRLKETSAIGVLTKLSLKNQVDDLVARFRAYHDGSRPPTLAELRPGFELLLMKVLSLLQDKDAALAHDINASRDAIWSVLADKQKFAEIS